MPVGHNLIECEVVAKPKLIKDNPILTIAQALVITAHLTLGICATLALLNVFQFPWLLFGLVWGILALIIQVGHWVAYRLYMNSVRAGSPMGRGGTTEPCYLVGAATLRDIQLGTIVSTAALVIFAYVVFMIIFTQGIDDPPEHAIQLPFIMLLALVSLGTLFFMAAAFTAQRWPVANIKNMQVAIRQYK